VIQKLCLFMKRLMGRLPEDLPTGVPELNAFIESILSLYNLPNKPDYQRTVVTMVQHISQERFRAPKYYFYRQIKRSEAMRAAFLKLRELNEAEKLAATQNQEKTPEPLQDACIQTASGPMGPNT
jgi:hypothetical protein